MNIFDPVGRSVASVRALTPRPASLAGITVGVIDNSKPNAGVLLGRVAELLVERAGAAEVRTGRKPSAAMGATALQLDDAAGSVGLLLAGSAD